MAKRGDRNTSAQTTTAQAEVVARFQQFVGELVADGHRGLTLLAQIATDGSVTLTAHPLETPETGAKPHLTLCEFDRLSLSGLVAFAMRCVLRCLPFATPYLDRPALVVAVASGLRAAEGVADGQRDQSREPWAAWVEALQDFAADFPPRSSEPAELAAHHAAHALCLAFDGIDRALDSWLDLARERVRSVAVESAIAGAHAAEAVLAEAGPLLAEVLPRRLGAAAFGQAMARDFQRLLALQDIRFRLDETGPLGPLWEGGLPDWLRQGMASQGWQPVAEVLDECAALQRVATRTPSYAQLRELAEKHPPAATWFEEETSGS